MKQVRLSALFCGKGMIVLGLFILILLQLVCSQNIITTIAGTGTASYSGDGSAATSATLKFPLGLALDSSGISYLTIL